jgi:hypothetical protein
MKFSQMPASLVGVGDNYFFMLRAIAYYRARLGVNSADYQQTSQAGFAVIASYLWSQGQHI